MTLENEIMRGALREIESRATTALANQPYNADECERHLNKALGAIELKAHVARWGQEGYPLSNCSRDCAAEAETEEEKEEEEK